MLFLKSEMETQIKVTKEVLKGMDKKEVFFVGIDLGTTNTLACYEKKEKATMLTFDGGKKMLPSVLYVNEDGVQFIGKKAVNYGKEDPKNRISSSKTSMGDMGKVWTCNGKKYTPTQVATEILKEVKRTLIKKANLSENTLINAVITFPAEFTASQKDETVKAGYLAGFNEVKTITEPMAAAITAAKEINIDKKVLVVDIGGGTYDLSILQADLANEEYRAIAIGGNRHLGGDDFDQAIVDYCFEQIERETGIDLSTHENIPFSMGKYYSVRGSIYSEAREAKEEITEYGEYEINLPNLFDDRNGNAYDFSLNLNLEKFDEICAGLYKAIFKKLDEFLNSQTKEIRDGISEIILAGGSCYIPYIQNELKKRYGLPVDARLDLSTLVATGAYYVAHNYWDYSSIDEGKKSPVQLLSHSFGVEVFTNGNSLLSKLIPRYTEYPCSASDEYTTVIDNQDEIEINVYEAAGDYEDECEISKHHFYGQLTLKGIQKGKAGVPRIKVTFTFDENCCLTVRAEDKITKVHKEAVITKMEKPKESSNVRPTDIMLLLDVSGSMGGPPIDQAKYACNNLFNEMIDFNIHSAGIITFGSNVQLCCNLTKDKYKLLGAVNAVSVYGSTDLTGALMRADAVFVKSNNDKIVIVVTDGWPDHADTALKVAQKLRDKGIRVVAIGAGNSIGKDFLSSLASDYYLIKNMGQLKEVFQTVINSIAKV